MYRTSWKNYRAPAQLRATPLNQRVEHILREIEQRPSNEPPTPNSNMSKTRPPQAPSNQSTSTNLHRHQSTFHQSKPQPEPVTDEFEWNEAAIDLLKKHWPAKTYLNVGPAEEVKDAEDEEPEEPESSGTTSSEAVQPLDIMELAQEMKNNDKQHGRPLGTDAQYRNWAKATPETEWDFFNHPRHLQNI